MCGLAGVLGAIRTDPVEPLLRAAAAALRHRGPDGDAVWSDAKAGIGFAHTRLRILELSDAGAQPMHSADGRMVLIHNGEIYNHLGIRSELQSAGFARAFRGGSDTETLVEACAHWGVEATVRRCHGMFAFALWDRHERALHLVRDRIGIKPLFWGVSGDRLIFGSELKALLPLLDRRPELDAQAVGEFLRYGFIPAPRSVYSGISKLPAGAMLTCRAGVAPYLSRYWTLEAAATQPRTARFPDVVDDLDRLLRDVVREQLVADVPVGAFLSGGIDSSLVAALMQQVGAQPARTFSIGFAESSHDESAHAAAVARHLGTAHTELRVTPAEALAVIPELAHHYDEPFADSSQIPTLLLARLARATVTVALSGDGGDETFAGYTRHVVARLLLAPALGVPLAVRRVLARGLDAVRPSIWDAFAAGIPAAHRPRQPADKARRLAAVLHAAESGIYAALLATWPESPRGTGGAGAARTAFGDPATLAQLHGLGERLQYLDGSVYLPDDALVKVDRATMAAALECRVPLLDHRVVEAAWRVPWPLRVRGLTGKWIARQVLSRYVPARLIERPKSGFSIPLADWLRGGLRDWAEAMLTPAQLARCGMPEPVAVRKLWQEHLGGRCNGQHALWNVLTYQAWHEHWR
ncbi:MAG: asparagine synthase (glutamine-hydrolyzing) [Gammaproteobacteria bacterium]|nr:asparagine synthase (glutamine-hydrolyzing) [Gammaproteobacteria bacterium]